jgi:hypothetical protein
MPFAFAGRVCFAVFVLLGFASLPASAQGVDFKQSLARCQNKDGAVLLKLGQPETVWRTFCSEDLEKLSCDPLDFIKQYMLYSYGACYNNVDGRSDSKIYGHIYAREACVDSAAKRKHNGEVYNKIPSAVWPMIVLVENALYKKNCRDHMESFN